MQSLLVSCLGKLIQYATEQGYALTLGEGFVRRLRSAQDGTLYTDGVHMPGSLHYLGLACDLNLFVHGVYISAGTSPAWVDLGEYWESLDRAAMWGGRFKSLDSNHFSLEWHGVKLFEESQDETAIPA